MEYEIYNGQTIYGESGENFMKRNNHLKGVIYLIKHNGYIITVESKEILSRIFNIDINLSDEEFMQEYFKLRS